MKSSRSGDRISRALLSESALKWVEWSITRLGTDAGTVRQWFEQWLPEGLVLGEKWVRIVEVKGYKTPRQQIESLHAILSTCKYKGIPFSQLFQVAPFPTLVLPSGKGKN